MNECTIHTWRSTFFAFDLELPKNDTRTLIPYTVRENVKYTWMSPKNTRDGADGVIKFLEDTDP